ncbi:MAG: hypothetical protein H7257_06565 [Taibaiella sp.]|nr:hypothetical protein [Taibaiella sp.]
MLIAILYFYYAVLLSLCYISVRAYKRMQASLKFVCILGVLTFVNEMVSAVLGYYSISKAYGYHFYNIVELALIAYAFVFYTNKKPGKGLLISISFGSIMLGGINMAFLQPINKVNTNMLMVECVLSIGMALAALFHLLKNDTTFNIYRSPNFIFWSAILLLMTGTFFFWACFEFLIQSNSKYKLPLIVIQVIINIVAYISIAVALLIKQEKTQNE